MYLRERYRAETLAHIYLIKTYESKRDKLDISHQYIIGLCHNLKLNRNNDIMKNIIILLFAISTAGAFANERMEIERQRFDTESKRDAFRTQAETERARIVSDRNTRVRNIETRFEDAAAESYQPSAVIAVANELFADFVEAPLIRTVRPYKYSPLGLEAARGNDISKTLNAELKKATRK